MAMNYGAAKMAQAQSLNAAKTPDMGMALRMGYENGKHLLSLIERARMVADHLCGGIPRPAGDERQDIGTGIVAQMSTFFRAEQDALADLSNELSRIEFALGCGPATMGVGAAGVGAEMDVANGQIIGRPY